MAGKRERNKQANRAAILAAARACFVERGYDAVAVRDIVRRTDLAAGTFYNYFPDKESVFRALLEERINTLTERLTRLRRGTGPCAPSSTRPTWRPSRRPPTTRCSTR